MGAMSGSRNTNGQMHPATVHWQTETGDRYYLRPFGVKQAVTGTAICAASLLKRKSQRIH